MGDFHKNALVLYIVLKLYNKLVKNMLIYVIRLGILKGILWQNTVHEEPNQARSLFVCLI